MEYFEVIGWKDFQHYKDRNPPWIKLHNQLLENYKFSLLPDNSKGHLLCIWMLASRTSNKIPYNSQWIASKISATSKINLDILIEYEFIQLIQQDARCLQNASIVLHKEKKSVPSEEERRDRERGETDSLFSEFWNAYPKKVDKKKAEASFNRLKPNNELKNNILAHIRKQLENGGWNINEKNFIPHPTTYLNGRRWEDEIIARPISIIGGGDGANF